MNTIRHIFFFLLINLPLPLLTLAQEEGDEEEIHEFTDLKSALKNPELVLSLDLRKQKLIDFPKEIFLFTNLEKLNLSKNKITDIPSEIGTLTQLKELDLSGNRIELLPLEIGNLIQLKRLILGKNDLYSLPRSFGNFQSLEYLDLWSNNITELPKEMSTLTNLKILDMRLIQMNKEKQEAIQQLLPHTLIYFSPSCNCD